MHLDRGQAVVVLESLDEQEIEAEWQRGDEFVECAVALRPGQHGAQFGRRDDHGTRPCAAKAIAVFAGLVELEVVAVLDHADRQRVGQAGQERSDERGLAGPGGADEREAWQHDGGRWTTQLQLDARARWQRRGPGRDDQRALRTQVGRQPPAALLEARDEFETALAGGELDLDHAGSDAVARQRALGDELDRTQVGPTLQPVEHRRDELGEHGLGGSRVSGQHEHQGRAQLPHRRRLARLDQYAGERPTHAECIESPSHVVAVTHRSTSHRDEQIGTLVECATQGKLESRRTVG